MFKALAFLCLIFPCFGALPQLTLEEKIGQLLMVHFRGQKVNEDARTLIQDVKVGAIIYYNWANGLDSPEQVQTLSSGLQTLAQRNPHPIPLLIAADQEGGVVTRLSKGFTQFPGNRALGESEDPQLVETVSFAMGQELKAVGVNMNLAPVVDVNCNPRNPIIGVRSFGEDPEKAAVLGKSSLTGYHNAGVIATLKHFPGYGDVAVDPHEDLPKISKTKDALQKVELLPFEKLADSAEAIMTAHILVPALDPENCSTLSEKTLSYLRDTLGFKGVIVADSLVMDGVMKRCDTVDEAAIQALQAGCDILILGGKLLSGEHVGFELTVTDVKRIHRSLVEAVLAGRVSEEKVDQAVQRILALKQKYLASPPREINLADVVNTGEHRALAQTVASVALKKEGGLLGPLQEETIAIVAPQLLQEGIEQTDLSYLGKSYYFSSLNPPDSEIESAQRHVQGAEVVLIFSYNAWKNPAQTHLIQSLIATGKPVVLAVMRDPLDAALFPGAHQIFTSFSPTVPSLQAISKCLGTK